MILITLALAGYIALGWLGLIPKITKSFGSFVLWNTFLFGMLWFVFIFLANWLQVNQELLFLFAVGIGSVAYQNKVNASLGFFTTATMTSVGLSAFSRFMLLLFAILGYPFFLGALWYHWYIVGFLPTLYLFLLGSVASVIVYFPLMRFPVDYGRDFTHFTSYNQAALFMVVAFGNIILRYFLYGV